MMHLAIHERVSVAAGAETIAIEFRTLRPQSFGQVRSHADAEHPVGTIAQDANTEQRQSHAACKRPRAVAVPFWIGPQEK